MKNTFTKRKLKREFRPFHYLAIATLLLSSFFLFKAVQESLCQLVLCQQAHAEESYHFGMLPWRTITLPSVSQNYDLDRLAKAVARHETGDCTARVGSALYRNCHGFRLGGHFLHFKAKADSYAYFKDLWARKYGDEFPTIRHATSWVCGPRWPTGQDCPGGSPRSWLANVTHFYDSL